PTDAFLESLNPRYRPLIQLEALAAILLHAAMIYFWKIPILNYLVVMFGFGFMWSAMQYAHHYGTVRDVQKGAMNLKTFPLLDLGLAKPQLPPEPHSASRGALPLPPPAPKTATGAQQSAQGLSARVARTAIFNRTNREPLCRQSHTVMAAAARRTAADFLT